MNGKISDDTGPLIGANVIAVHTPSGSMYGTSTNEEGYYYLPNMRVGGPYTLTVSYTGYAEYVQENIYLSLGQTFRASANLTEDATLLDGVEVVADRYGIFDSDRTGQSTVVDEKTINDIPTISRAIGDYVRFNPLANISEDEDGFAISIAGQNNRYNAIYIDGAVNNDVFGLSDSGTNGGQTGVQPISIDAIEQFVVNVAPFDVRQSGFSGGSINAITRSGTNNFEGSAYYFLRNQALSGLTPTDNDAVSREPLPDFSAQTFGARLGGPIVKDKVFFFVNYEGQRDETPLPFNIADYEGEASADQLEALRNNVSESYGYDLGTYTQNASSLNSDKILAKLDFNLSNEHKLTVRHSWVRAENLEARNSSAGSINFENGSEFFVSSTNSSAIELNSVLGNNMSNRFIAGFTFVRDDRDPSGDPFPTVRIFDGDDGVINLGAERFSTANLLNQDVITLTNDFTYYKGRHSILAGVNFEYFNAGNLFIRNNFGRYTWDDSEDGDGNLITGLDNFLAGEPASEYERSFSQVDNVAGDDSEAIADFSAMNVGVYLQDEFQVTDRLTITGGLRLDVDTWLDDQPVNEEFNNTTIPAIEEVGYDLLGAQTGSFISTQFRFSPRLGFNFDVNGDRTTQIRGGMGIFNSRAPLVWAGGAFNNYGFNIGAGASTDQEFVADVQNQPIRADLSNVTPSGQIDLFSDDFKLPQVFKANVGIDQKLPWGLIGTLEGLLTLNVNDVQYQNLNIKPATERLAGTPDTRPLFAGALSQFGADVVDPTYTYIMLADNTGEGYAYNFAATLTKQFQNGLAGSVSYSWGDSYKTYEGTSSQNNSNWRGYHVPLDVDNFNGGRNDIGGEAQRTRFAQGHRIFGQISYVADYKKSGNTRVSLNFNAQTGGFFSYVVGARNFRFVDDGGFDNNELFYVPASQSEINFEPLEVNGVTYSPEEQWQALDAYITANSNLDDRRGNYATRNSGRLPFQFNADFRVTRDFPIPISDTKTNILQFSFDIFNVTNLLNRDWGRRRFAGSFGSYNIVDLQDIDDNNVPIYTFNDQLIEDWLNPEVDDKAQPWTNRVDDTGFRSSRWQAQVGIRYIFR